MNAAEFLVYGPASLYLLDFVILFLAIVLFLQLKHSREITNEMKEGRKATVGLQTELEKILPSLTDDTTQLKEATTGLKTELGSFRQSIEAFHKTMRRINQWWLAYQGGD